MVYRLLLRNQWRTFFRGLRTQQRHLILFILGLFSLYLAFTLITLGYFFERFTILFAGGQSPLAVVNAHVLWAAGGLFCTRFLFQKTPRMKLLPYLHLPIKRRYLVRFFQATSLLSVHNLFPLLFVVPFWSRYILGSVPLSGAVSWLAGVVAILAASNFANLFIRSLLSHHIKLFLGLASLVFTLTVVDLMSGTLMVQAISTYLFEALLADEVLVLLLLLTTTVWTGVASSQFLRQSLHQVISPPKRRVKAFRAFSLLTSLGPAGTLMWLECQMMWRSKRPRHYMLISVLFSTVYLVFLLANPTTYGGILFGGIIGLFASGGFALNYGQLMFSWESQAFDGHLARPTGLRHYALSKLLLLQFSCIILFLISFPLFLWLRPEMLMLHVAFLLYNAGITSILIMLLALRNRSRVNVSRSGGFFNYEGFSAMHWLWFFPTALPPVLFLYVMRATPTTGLMLLGGLGLVSVLATHWWSKYFAACLQLRRHDMAEGFRNHED